MLVDFIGGDIDRPIIVGQAYNGADLPPFSAGHEAGANHPGVLSGWMSHNFEEGHNQWVLDDSPGQLRTRLATSENAGQLGLGHLIQQAPDSANRGARRGSGFEVRSDAWLAVRAGDGILISSTARLNGQSTQMDVAEAVAHSVQFQVKTTDGKPVSGFNYEIRSRTDGSLVAQGVTNKLGMTERHYTEEENSLFDLHECHQFGMGSISPSTKKEFD